MSQKKNEGILFSAKIRVVGCYTDRLLRAQFQNDCDPEKNNLSKRNIFDFF